MKEQWLEIGYKEFASAGPTGLKVEPIARILKKNKSSFYHYFGDIDLYTQFLLDYHLEQAKVLAQKEAACETQDELIDILVAHKVDILFSRQLRIHRENPAYEKCFEAVSAIVGPAILGIWSKIIELDDHSYLAALVFKLGIENFYLRITEDNLNHAWLNDYFAEFKQLVRAFKNQPSIKQINGTV
ncbi:MAG: TetR/AcrR family transcriptional regulator [Bacteroidota bacterium]